MAKSDSTLATETLQGKIFFLLNLLTEHRMMVFNIVGFEVIFSLLSALVPYFTKLQIDQLQSRSASIFRFAQFDPVLVFGLLLLIPATIELVRLLFFDKFRNRITDSKIWTQDFLPIVETSAFFPISWALRELVIIFSLF